MTTLSAMERPPQPPPNHAWAKWVSDIISPPVVWMAVSLVVALAFSYTTLEALYWAGLYSLFVCVVPVLFILYNVYTGRIGDIHMQHRHERYRPLLVTIVANVVALALLILQDAPVVMKLLAIMSLIEVVIISAVTLYWQISMHAMAITGATMAVGVLLSLTLALLMIPLIVLVGAARLRLDRHTPMQVFAGAMVGAFAPVILFLMVLLI
jgi:membrane-associated phospholipid phosphatase